MADTEKRATFLPFHAINEFMRDDFRMGVVRETLLALPGLPVEERERIEKQIGKSVSIPGFRNSRKAPTQVKIKPASDSFQKNPALAAAVLSGWSSTHLELRSQLSGFLAERGWELLPAEADRTRLPGFIPTWPEGEGFEDLSSNFHARYPESTASDDQISLMVVWLSCRLPYQIVPFSELQPIPGLKQGRQQSANQEQPSSQIDHVEQ